MESIYSILSLVEGIVPHIKNLEDPLDPELNFAQANISKPMKVVLKNSLAFGGINSSLVYKAFEKEHMTKS